jgi:hypothetical protein
MQLVIGLAATGFSAVGMLVNNDFHVSFQLPVHLNSVPTTPRPRLHMDPVHCRILFCVRLFFMKQNS